MNVMNNVCNTEILIYKYSNMLDYLINRYSDKSISNHSYFCKGTLKEDVKQEAVITLLCAAKSYDETRNIQFDTYLTACVSHRLMNIRRNNSKNSNVYNLSDLITSEKDYSEEQLLDYYKPCCDEYSSSSYMENIDEAKDFLMSLVPQGYEIYKYNYVDELPMSEVSKKMNMSLSACYNNLRKFFTCVKQYVL